MTEILSTCLRGIAIDCTVTLNILILVRNVAYVVGVPTKMPGAAKLKM